MVDGVLFAAWQNKEPPFDRQTITIKKSVPLEKLASALLAVVQTLHKTFNEEPLYFLMDWHEHDGVVLPSHPSSWQTLQNEVPSKERLLELFDGGDTFVRRGFYGESRQFYLRFYVNEPYYAGPEDDGDFDLTVGEDLADNLLTVLKEILGENVIIAPANAFFIERYNG